MLIIRAEQMRVFEEASLCVWIAGSLETSYPAQAATLGAGLYAIVKAAVKQARAYGFHSDHDIRRYAHLAFILGSGFAEDAELPWAARILKDARLADPATRLSALEQATLHHLETQQGDRTEAPHGR